MRRVGVLMNGTANEATTQTYIAAFLQELRQLGWTEGQNVRIDIRYSAGDYALARTYAAQLIGLMPEVILTGSTTNLTAIREATNTVPVVFTAVSDPVGQGFVESLAKPGGNITGFSAFEFSIGGKWLDLLKRTAPRLARVAVLFNPDTSPQSKFFMRSIEDGAKSLGIELVALPVRTTGEIEPAMENFARQPNGGLVLPTDTFTVLRFQLIADTAIRLQLPTIDGNRADTAKQGGLIFYGISTDYPNVFRQAARYVDRILKGEKPAHLPVQNPSKYALVINLKTAKALGLTIPETLLATADEVIH